MNTDDQNNLLEKIASIFLWCVLMSVALLLFWFIFYIVAGDWAYRLHSKWFELSWHEYTVLNYYGMALVKLLMILFFLFPYLAIKLVLRKK